MPKELEPKEARQGNKGTPVLKVLIAALVLAALAWGAAEIFGRADAPDQPVGTDTIEEDVTDQPPTGEAPTVDTTPQ